MASCLMVQSFNSVKVLEVCCKSVHEYITNRVVRTLRIVKMTNVMLACFCHNKKRTTEKKEH